MGPMKFNYVRCPICKQMIESKKLPPHIAKKACSIKLLNMHLDTFERPLEKRRKSIISIIRKELPDYKPRLVIHCTVFRQASILSGSGFNEFLVGLLRFQFFSWKRNGLGINPAISWFFFNFLLYISNRKVQKTLFRACLSKICSTFHVNLISMNMQQKKLANKVTW